MMSVPTMWLLALPMLLGSSQALSNLPNHTELMVRVLVDSGWVRSNRMSMDNVERILTQVIPSARSNHVSMNIDVMELVAEENITLWENNVNLTAIDVLNQYFDVNETDVLITLTRCSTTHQLHDSLVAGGVDHILHVGMTGVPCARLDHTGVLMPMVTTDNNMVQLLRDFKHANTFYGWRSCIAILDEGVDKDMEDGIYQVMSQDASIATFRLPSNAGQHDINNVLRDIPAARLGGKFLILSKLSHVESFIKAVGFAFHNDF